MRILTVRQPWAWAIIYGGKDRSRRPRAGAAVTDPHSHNYWLSITGALVCACGDSRRPLPEPHSTHEGEPK